MRMMRRITDRQRAMMLQRLEETNRRIADQEDHIRKLRKHRCQAVEVERLLNLMHTSRELPQHQVDLLSKVKS